ncbi:hypothetical protein T492DRAFT_854142 [Pavlovales sp. CCMP2436]|nr:hypothetical protein T492DRAFT_854142 [Pavlovales sp. CCMP2436]
MRSNAHLILNSIWPPDDACHAALESMLEFVKEEGHLTWFLKNHYPGLPNRATHATHISMGTQMGATIASALTIPSSDVDVVYALLFAVNEVGKYKDCTYLTQRFPGMMKAHLEIDHVEGSDTVLNKAVMTDLLKKIAQEYKCEVFASGSSRGGNRAHDLYTPWLIYSHAKKHVCDASEMNMTIGDWVKKMTMA